MNDPLTATNSTRLPTKSIYLDGEFLRFSHKFLFMPKETLAQWYTMEFIYSCLIDVSRWSFRCSPDSQQDLAIKIRLKCVFASLFRGLRVESMFWISSPDIHHSLSNRNVFIPSRCCFSWKQLFYPFFRRRVSGPNEYIKHVEGTKGRFGATEALK